LLVQSWNPRHRTPKTALVPFISFLFGLQWRRYICGQGDGENGGRLLDVFGLKI